MKWSRILLASTIAGLLFLSLLIGGLALRRMVLGRIDAFFTSLSIFSIEFVAIMLFGYVLQKHILKRRTIDPSRAIIAFIALVLSSLFAGWVRVEVRDLTMQHVENVVAERLSDPASLPVWSALARETIDAEVFRYSPDHVSGEFETGPGERIVRTCDLMSEINGNTERRQLYARLLRVSHSLKEGATIEATDLMLNRKQLGVYYVLAMVSAGGSVLVFLWAVVEVVRSLYMEARDEGATNASPAGGGV